MRRHRSLGFLAGTLLALALAASATAKSGEDEIVVALDPPDNPHAGAPIEVGVLMTRASNGSALRGESVTFQIARNGGIGLVTVQAKEDTMGHYTAMVTVPDKGSWTVVVTATGGGMTQTFHAGDLRIGAPLATPTPATPTATAAPAWVLIAGLVALALAAGAASWIFALRRRSTVTADRA